MTSTLLVHEERKQNMLIFSVYIIETMQQKLYKMVRITHTLTGLELLDIAQQIGPSCTVCEHHFEDCLNLKYKCRN